MGSCIVALTLVASLKMSINTKVSFTLSALIVISIAVLVMGQDLLEIPTDLSFSCDGREYGYYADPATNCKVFHICLGDGDIKWSLLCPNQTIFNQQYFVCDYAINVECNNAESFYSLNANFGQVTNEEEGVEEVCCRNPRFSSTCLCCHIEKIKKIS